MYKQYMHVLNNRTKHRCNLKNYQITCILFTIKQAFAISKSYTTKLYIYTKDK